MKLSEWLKLLRSAPFAIALIWFVWSGYDVRWAVTALIVIVALLDANLVASREWMDAATQRISRPSVRADPWTTVPRKCATPECPWGATEGSHLCAKCRAS